MKNYKTLDIFWFIGLKNNDSSNILAIPFVFNTNHSKIKTLTDEKIYGIKKR